MKGYSLSSLKTSQGASTNIYGLGYTDLASNGKLRTGEALGEVVLEKFSAIIWMPERQCCNTQEGCPIRDKSAFIKRKYLTPSIFPLWLKPRAVYHRNKKKKKFFNIEH